MSCGASVGAGAGSLLGGRDWVLVAGVPGPAFRAVRPGGLRGPCDSSPSPSATETLRTESRAPSGRSPPPSGRARTASCTRGRPCMAPRRSGWPQPRARAGRVEACSELTGGEGRGGHVCSPGRVSRGPDTGCLSSQPCSPPTLCSQQSLSSGSRGPNACPRWSGPSLAR